MSINDQQNKLCNEAAYAEQNGQLDRACELFTQAVNLDRANPTPYLFLGSTLEQQEKFDAAASIFSLAADMSPHVITAWRNENLDNAIKARSKQANERVRRHFTHLHQACVQAFVTDHPTAEVTRVREAIWCQTHDQSFSYKHPQQRPHVFYVPGLAQQPIMARQNLAWAALLEESADAIREEFLTLQNTKLNEQRPYVGEELVAHGEEWRPLAGTLAWGSFDLYKNGQPNTAVIEHCPKTIATLERLPVLRVNGTPREVVFSVLQGGSHIPPHFGLANTDATVHLPLITSPQSAIKVLDVVTDWHLGKTFAFDDSYLHESWNHSDDARVNLLFEVWHPDLNTDEQNAIAHSFATRQAWNAQREQWLDLGNH